MNPSTSLLSPKDVGGFNRARVLRALADHGPLSRSDLARLANVTRATIGSIVQGLISDEILEEGDPVEDRQVGKPARPLWFAAGAGTVIAVELRGPGVRAAVVDARGQMSADEFQPFDDPTSVDHVGDVVRTLVQQLAREHPVMGVGIAVPGSTDLANGVVVGSTQVPGAIGRALVDDISRATGLATYVENDSRAQALAEQWFGRGRGERSFTSVQTGDGLSAGLVLDGTVFRGPNGVAGELGHTTVVVDGERCMCGLLGCWETIATLRWLRAVARQAGIRGAKTLTCADLLKLSAKGNLAATELAERYVENLAVGLANIRNLLGSTMFILHGDVVGGGEPFRQRLEAAASRRALGPVQVVLTELDDRASILGAVAVVLTETLHVSG